MVERGMARAPCRRVVDLVSLACCWCVPFRLLGTAPPASDAVLGITEKSYIRGFAWASRAAARDPKAEKMGYVCTEPVAFD